MFGIFYALSYCCCKHLCLISFKRLCWIWVHIFLCWTIPRKPMRVPEHPKRPNPVCTCITLDQKCWTHTLWTFSRTTPLYCVNACLFVYILVAFLGQWFKRTQQVDTSPYASIEACETTCVCLVSLLRSSAFLTPGGNRGNQPGNRQPGPTMQNETRNLKSKL